MPTPENPSVSTPAMILLELNTAPETFETPSVKKSVNLQLQVSAPTNGPDAEKIIYTAKIDLGESTLKFTMKMNPAIGASGVLKNGASAVSSLVIHLLCRRVTPLPQGGDFTSVCSTLRRWFLHLTSSFHTSLGAR